MKMDTIFENYELFLKEHEDSVSTPQSAMRMLNDEGMYRAYVESLTEGFDSSVRSNILGILSRERDMILSEGANVGASSFASGWTVMAFPILVDIYAEPIISELCNLYPVDKPTISVPRIRIKAKTRSYDGSTEEETYIPTPTKLVRAGVVNVNVVPGIATNVFTSATPSLDPKIMNMNRRYTLMTSITIQEGGAGSTSYPVKVMFRPDSRNQISQVFKFDDAAGAEVECRIIGNIDYDKGSILFHANFSGGTSGVTYEALYGTFGLRFIPVTTMNGRTVVSVEMEQTDLYIDPMEDFLIDLTEEMVQDFGSIWKIDLMRTLSEAIKRQIVLNKDYDLAYFLGAAEPDMAKVGAAMNVNMDNFAVGGTTPGYAPNSVLDVFKGVVPHISTMISTIRRNFNMYPSYIVTGLKTASMLRSMQDFATNMPTIRGELGFAGGTSQFLKMKVLESTVIEDNKMYFSTKAPQNSLEKSSIVDFVYQPLYIVKEITDGNTRHFIRNRAMIEILRTDGLGYIELGNLNKYVG